MIRKVIIDCDPGIDDAFALTVAHFEKQLEICAITTVAGNVSIENTTNNALGLMHVLGLDIPVYKGSHEPLVYEPFFASEVHGHNGFGGVHISHQKQPESQSALEGMVKILRESTDKITLVALGPLTNIALLLKGYPELKEKIECISLMGGGLKGGNTTIAGEFNFYVDPHAAHIVFNSDVDIIMAGLDVTEIGNINREAIETIRDHGGEVGKLLYDISQVSFNFSNTFYRSEKIHLHDVMAVLYLTQPDLFKVEKHFVEIAYEDNRMRGLSLADVRPRSQQLPNATVMVDVDIERFKEAIVSIITQGGNDHE